MCWKAETLLCEQRSYSQGYGLPSGQVLLWELDHKEGKTPKNWCLQTVVLEKTPESPLDSKEINQSILSEINPEYSLEGLMLKLKRHYFCHLMHTKNLLAKSWCWERSGQKENRVSEDERAGQHYGCNEHELRLTLRWQGTGSLVCCSPWGHKESDVTVQPNNNNVNAPQY